MKLLGTELLVRDWLGMFRLRLLWVTQNSATAFKTTYRGSDL
jgi:hypothetical protein